MLDYSLISRANRQPHLPAAKTTTCGWAASLWNIPVKLQKLPISALVLA